MAKKREMRSFEEYLDERLIDKEKVLEYLEAACMGENPKVFILALEDVLRAQKKYRETIDHTELTQEDGSMSPSIDNQSLQPFYASKEK